MTRQKYLSPKLMISFITFMNMFVPFSTDMYLPALPEMGGYFSAEQSLVSLTLTAFFFVFAVSIVVFGPLSDKYGRRPVLIGGAILYVLASLGCAFAPSIYALIAMRMAAAVGAGAIITVSTALIKDCFRGAIMQKILAITQALGVIAPVVAPIIGGLILSVSSWRGSFVFLAVFGIVNLALAFLLTETLPEEKRYHGSIISSLSLLAEFYHRKAFIMLLTVFSFFSVPFMTYLSLSSFIYIDGFSLTAQEYSYFFAVNAAASGLGPFLYLRLNRRLSRFALANVCMASAVVVGCVMLNFGHISAVAFLSCFIPCSVLGSITRPFVMNWLLSETKDHIGTASAVINFIQNLFASFGMMLGSLPWNDYIDGLAFVMLGSSASAIVLWRFVAPMYRNKAAM